MFGLSKIVRNQALVFVGVAVLLGYLHNFEQYKCVATSCAPAQMDFIQADYLSALAISHNLDPYSNLSSLAKQFLPIEFTAVSFLHPNPHSPLNILLALPFSSLEPYILARVWSLIQLITLCLSLGLAVTTLNGNFRWRWFFASLAVVLSTHQIAGEFSRGQTGTISLLLVTLAYRRICVKDDAGAGLAIGLCVALKFIGTLFLLDCLIRKQFRIVGFAIASFIGANLIASAFLGFRGILRYYFEIAPFTSGNYLKCVWNQSLWTLGFRLFSISKPIPWQNTITEGFVYDPLISDLPLIAPLSSYLFLVLFGAWAAYISWRDTCRLRRFHFLLMANLAILPVLWAHYLTVSLLTILFLIECKKINLLQFSFKNYIIPIVFFFGYLAPQVVQEFTQPHSRWIMLASLPDLLTLALCMIALTPGGNQQS